MNKIRSVFNNFFLKLHEHDNPKAVNIESHTCDKGSSMLMVETLI